MTETTFTNVRLVDRERPVPPPSGMYPSVIAAILADRPALADIFNRDKIRPATEEEAARYEARRTDPAWSGLYRLVLDGEMVREGRLGPMAPGSPLIAIPAPSEPPAAEPVPEPQDDPAPVSEPEPDEPALDSDATRLMPPAEQPTEVVRAVDGGES